MRDLKRNQVPFWYSLYEGKEPVMDGDRETGTYRDAYSAPVKAMASISVATGAADADLFGTSVSYDRVISTVVDLPIDEYSKIWIETTPASAETPADYRVKRRAVGLNQNLWAIEREIR